MKSKGLFLFLVLLISCSCNNINTKESQTEQVQRELNTKELSFYTDTSKLEIFVLNDNAVKLLQQSQNSNYNPQLIDSLLKEALTYLDLAIKKDSNFYVAYLNKSEVYRGLGQYDNAIKALEELLHRKKHPEAIFFLGLINEKQGNQKFANEKYKEAYDAYLEYLKSPLSTSKDEMYKDYVLLFLEGKEKVLQIINQKLKEDPNNTSLLIDKSIIEEFSREEFISNF